MMSFSTFFPAEKPDHLGANLSESPIDPSEMERTLPVLETDEDSAHSVPPAAVACSQALPGTSGIFGDAWVIDEDDLDWDTQTSKAEDTQKPEAKKTPDTQKPEAEGTQEPQAEVTEQPQAEEKQNPEDEGTQQAKAKEEQSPDDEEEQKPEDEIKNPKDEKTQHNEDKEAENPYHEKIQRSLPALTKDEDFREREIILNCLANAVECIPDMQRCVTEAGSALRWHVERLLTKCGDVATCTLWTRIKTLIDELRELLFYCNDVADGKYDNMLESILYKAAEDATPPNKQGHWAYLQPGVDPEPTILSLKDDMEMIITYMHQFLFDMPA